MPKFTPPLTEAEINGAFPGDFSLVTTVFAGGQGSVFRVERPDGTVGALKIYVPDPGAEIEERTDREVEALARLSRPSIVRLDGYGTTTIRGERCQFVCTTFIDGETLSERLAGRGALAIDEVARVGHDIADAIEELWTPPYRVVHRDIKPPNVMLAASGHAVLIDLGVARHTTLESLTVTGTTWGTRGFMSPEQAGARKALTCKSDIFALGTMLQQCLAGRHPTNGNQAALANGGPSTIVIAPGTPPLIAQVIDAMVFRDATRRPLPAQVKATLLPFARTLGRPW